MCHTSFLSLQKGGTVNSNPANEQVGKQESQWVYTVLHPSSQRFDLNWTPEIQTKHGLEDVAVLCTFNFSFKRHAVRKCYAAEALRRSGRGGYLCFCLSGTHLYVCVL